MRCSNERSRWVVALVLHLLLAVGAAELAVAGSDAVLITVNGEDITAGRLDGMMSRLHRDMSPEGLAEFDSRTLLVKAVNDCLLEQQARALGMEDDEAVRAKLEADRRSAGLKEFRKVEFRPASGLPDGTLQEEFEEYYWRIRLRQLTVRGESEARSMRDLILGGADMDSLSRAVSLDVMKNKGGLHNFKLWSDIELETREVAADLHPGELSVVFPYRGVWSLVRCEERAAADSEELDDLEPMIKDYLLRDQIKTEWRGFLDSLSGIYTVQEDEQGLAAIRADGEFVLDGRFLRGTAELVLSCGEEFSVSDRELRTEISHAAMQKGLAPFEEVYGLGLQVKRDELVLWRAADEGGYFSTASVEELVAVKRRDVMIESYLTDTIVPQISFRSDELREFYEENKNEWRGPDEVLLDVLVIDDAEVAQEMESRVASGADFDFVREQLDLGPAAPSSWAPLASFSNSVISEVERLEIGEGSSLIQIRTGFMIFQLEGRRPGKVKDYEDVEIQVKAVVFQREFNALLNEHLELLKERSEIEYHDEAVRVYFSSPKDE